ncbi:DUF2207 domain-containing protein [Cetobacterium sp.]|uniref:DUF2207 domain-containing protein n=1 Tax=Cetobacterium sp. TaxID=2071632 RepID=UPI003F40F4A6
MLRYSFSLFLLLVTLTSNLFADSGYVIDNYRVDITIDEKNIYKIEEDINVDFKEPRRGIYRVIPEVFNGREIKVNDIKTNVQTHAKDEGDYIYLRMGNPNLYVTGAKNYLIKFKQNLGWDRESNFDEVYYNLIGNDWDTTIKKLEFNITLPKEFDASKINFTSGVRGSRNNKGVKWSVSGNTISGYTLEPLGPKESVTIALSLPEGYFDFSAEKTMFYILKTLLYIIYIAVPTIAFVVWKKFRDEKQVIQTVEFYPPDNLTPTEVGYYIDGVIHSKDMTSLIFYWADKGYLKLNEIKGSGLFSKDDFEIEFLKSSNDISKEFENYMFRALMSFKNSDGKVRISSLKNRFYKHIEKAAEVLEIDLIMSKKTLYDSKSLRIGNSVKALIFVVIFATIVYLNYFKIQNLVELGLTIILAFVSILITIGISGKIKSRTDYGREILGRVEGFKRFLETAEKRKLEMLIHENPGYFYNILPYTIVLGVSQVWADKFKDLQIPPPQWYGGSNIGNAFMMASFMRGINNSMGALNDSMLSSPKAPTNFGGGGSSMGGGSSGGGAGGGGGGSW